MVSILKCGYLAISFRMSIAPLSQRPSTALQTPVKPNGITVSTVNMNELHFTDQKAHAERDHAACPESQGDSEEGLGANRSLSSTVRLFHRVQSCMHVKKFF